MRVIAFYLPQFYCFPENDEWWGKGFTEWTNVRKSKPLFRGHYQPTVPLNKNYYTLENIETIKWQAQIAKEHGVYGFCFYHYWFGENRILMEKPVELFLRHPEIDIHFCLSWANHNWTRTWTGGDNQILMDVRYGGEEEWEEHIKYLLPFLKDSRYIRIDDKPILVIYKPDLIPNLKEMLDYYAKRAKEEGLKGLLFISQEYISDQKINNIMDYHIQYEPTYSVKCIKDKHNRDRALIHSIAYSFDVLKHDIGFQIKKHTNNKLCKINTYSYDKIWKYILKRNISDRKAIMGCFVNCDVSPRRQDRAIIYKGATPEKFSLYFSELVKKTKKLKNEQIIFISAWNEWGEGMYLEPDEKNGYKYLEAIKNALK